MPKLKVPHRMPVVTDKVTATMLQVPKGHEKTEPLPAHVTDKPYHLSLKKILGSDKWNSIIKHRRLVFHLGGDCGTETSNRYEHLISWSMEKDFLVTDESQHPAFLYMLGDIVYPYGAAGCYYEQFYKPYESYAAPIFSIPGNHDGAIDRSLPKRDRPPSLSAWMNNFCATKSGLSNDGGNVDRDAMVQPGPYFTLVTPFCRFIGLYSNVPEGGSIDAHQQKWLVNELKNAKNGAENCFVCLHHTPYSADDHHKGSRQMADLLDSAFAQARHYPIAVLGAHVHNYQRFTRSLKDFDGQMIDVPYLVIGASGHAELHLMSRHGQAPALPAYPEDVPGLVLNSYDDQHHGFAKIEIDSAKMQFTYSISPERKSDGSPSQIDQFSLDLQSRRIIS